MEITINNKPYNIKPASQLTVKEYLTYQGKLTKDTKQYGALIAYISAVTGFEIKNIMDLDVSDGTTICINAAMGEVLEAQDMPALDEFYYKRTAERFYKKNINWKPIGARIMLEQKELNNGLEQCVYLLAGYISKTYDNDKVERIYKELQNYTALEVFGFNLFFFEKLTNGLRKEITFWQLFRHYVNISIRQSLRLIRGRG